MISRHTLLLVVPAMLLLAACTSEPETKPCTKNPGCANAIKVTVTDEAGAPEQHVTGTATVGAKSYTISCHGTEGSNADVTCFKGGFTLVDPPREAKMNASLNYDNKAYKGDTALTFADTYPNGKDCPGACYTSEATLKVVVQPDSMKPMGAEGAPAGGGIKIK